MSDTKLYNGPPLEFNIRGERENLEELVMSQSQVIDILLDKIVKLEEQLDTTGKEEKAKQEIIYRNLTK